MKRLLSILFGLFCMPYLASGELIAKKSEHIPELRWNWDEINTNDLAFPRNFMWGAAICEFQTSGAEGCPDSQWAQWEHKQGLHPSRKVCDSWNLYKKDIEVLKELGLNSYRFSIDWSKIEPREGEIDQSALDHYVEMCDALVEAGIKPVVTLHHFVHPQWFEQLGGFEKKENIAYFVRFSELVFKTLGSRVGLWATFNEPAVYVMQGYVRGVYPPGKSGYFGVKTASKVLKNVLNAHVEVYHALKALPGGKDAKIGIVHQYLKFEPYHGSGWSHTFEKFIASQFDWVHKTVIDFFKTGLYHFKVTAVANVHEDFRTVSAEERERRIGSLDYIGLNYYSHVFLKGDAKEIIRPSLRECDIPTGMPFGVYAEGLYQAVKHVAEIGLPIYITENGAPTPDEACRDTWIKRYLYTVSKLLKEGYDIRGYIYWTLMDNYEWDMGYHQKFGLCSVDEKTQERIFKPGAEHYKTVVAMAKGRDVEQKTSWFSRFTEWIGNLFKTA